MGSIARSWDQVMAREYTSAGTAQQQWDDALGMASAIYNRSVALGVDYNTVVANKNEFNGYGNTLKPGDYARMELAKKAMQEVEANGPVHTGMFFATPRAVSGLPSGLVDTGYAVTNGHIYKEDPMGRSIAIKGGKYVKPNTQALNQELALKGVAVPAPQLRPADVPLGVPVPETNPMSTVNAVASAISAPLAATATVPGIGVAQPTNAAPATADVLKSALADMAANQQPGQLADFTPETAAKTSRVGTDPGFDPGRMAQAPADEGRFSSAYKPNMGPAMVDLTSALAGTQPSFDDSRFSSAPVAQGYDALREAMSAPVDPMMAATEGPYSANGLTNVSAALEVPAVSVPVSSVPAIQQTADLSGFPNLAAALTATPVSTLSVDATGQIAPAAAPTPMSDPGGYDMNARREYENSPAGMTDGLVQNAIAQNAKMAAADQSATANIASDNAVRNSAPPARDINAALAEAAALSPASDMAARAAQPSIDVTGTATATQGTPVTGALAEAYKDAYQQAAQSASATDTYGNPTQSDTMGRPTIAGPSLVGATQRYDQTANGITGLSPITAPASVSTPVEVADDGVGSPPTTVYDPATNRNVSGTPVVTATPTVTPTPTTAYEDPMVTTDTQTTAAAPAVEDTGTTETSGLPVPPADVGTPTVSQPSISSPSIDVSGLTGVGSTGARGNNLGSISTPTSPDTDGLGRVSDAMFSGRTAGSLGGALLGLALAGGNPLGLLAGSLLGGVAGQSLLGDQQPDESPLGALFGLLTGAPPGSKNGTGGYGSLGQGGSFGPGNGPSGSAATGGKR